MLPTFWNYICCARLIIDLEGRVSKDESDIDYGVVTWKWLRRDGIVNVILLSRVIDFHISSSRVDVPGVLWNIGKILGWRIVVEGIDGYVVEGNHEVKRR